MNYSTAVFLINKNVRAVTAVYESESSFKGLAPRTIFKTLDATITVGDHVIVPTTTRHNMTVCKIVEVDVDVDFDSAVQMQWIIGKVDDTPYKLILSQEAAAIDKIKSAELRQKRADLRTALFADNLAEIAALPIAAMNGDAKTV